MDPDRLQSYLQAIEAVFAEVPRPECTKRVAEALDDEWFPSPERVKELQEQDLETRWQELSDEDLVEYCSTLSWMSPEAVRFYYPAFLHYALRHWTSHDRVHLEVMETPGYDPKMLDEFSGDESRLIHALLSDLASTPGGSNYNFIPTLLSFKAHFD